jgi:hypothetical protein
MRQIDRRYLAPEPLHWGLVLLLGVAMGVATNLMVIR